MAYSLKKFTSKTTERERHKKKHFTDRTNLKHHNQKNIIFSACFASNLCGSNRCKYIMYISERFNFTWKLENHNFPDLQQRSYCFCRLQAAMLSSAEFICLRVAYPEAFWEELSWLIWRGRSIRRPLLFWVQAIFFHSLPSRVGCSLQGKLFSIFKLLCLVFVRYYFSSRTALENCVLFVIALRSSWEKFFDLYKICFAHASH